MNHLLIIIGTRPELIKTAPIIQEMNRRGMDFTVLNTAQHKDLLTPYWRTFDLQPHHSLDVMQSGQSLSALTAKVLTQMQDYLDAQGQEVDTILAQGDTTTVLGASMVAMYNRKRFVHLEAGLRSHDFDNPFPEEYNRRVAAIAADLHLAPTQQSADNLLAEGVAADKVKVIGNTVVDALQYMVGSASFQKPFDYAPLNILPLQNRNAVLITCHRRENHGENLLKIIEALRTLASQYDNLQFVWPVHPNPNVLSTVKEAGLSAMPNFLITPPLEYMDLLKLLSRCRVAVSDSGGIQEEAPSFGVPVVVLRETTERPEGVQNGLATLAGADPERIQSAFIHYLHHPLSGVQNPFGDGQAAVRAVEAIVARK